MSRQLVDRHVLHDEAITIRRFAVARTHDRAPLAEGIDATTPAGKLQMHILGAIAEFERGRIVERVRAGLARVRTQGVRLGRPRNAGSIQNASLRSLACPTGRPRDDWGFRGRPCSVPWPQNPPKRPADFRPKPGYSDIERGGPESGDYGPIAGDHLSIRAWAWRGPPTESPRSERQLWSLRLALPSQEPALWSAS